MDGKVIGTTVNGMASDVPLACVNCHRESGLGTSESGKTIPPVNWDFLSRDRVYQVDARFRPLQNSRPPYDAQLLHRILSEGIDSSGELIDNWMPRYRIDAAQTTQLVDYLKQLYVADDPGVDDETMYIATIVDRRLDASFRQQHIDFLTGLFRMKNSLTRGELKRKQFSPVQKNPQYRSYRKWKLVVWELSEDTGSWDEQLDRYYRDQAVFTVLTPVITDTYEPVRDFCQARELPCLFAQGNGDFAGDYFNFVFRDRRKQRDDFVARALRKQGSAVYGLNRDGTLGSISTGQASFERLDASRLDRFRRHHDDMCRTSGTLLAGVGIEEAGEIYRLACPDKQGLKITLIGDESVDYEALAQLVAENPQANICWATDYDRVLKFNSREIRVRVLARRFGMTDYDGESLAQVLYAFGMLSNTAYQLAGNFSRKYLLENIEHMLNSHPNATYFSTVTGAPYQRAIVGPLREFCPGGSAT